jgi:hypothetical protein
MSNESDRVAAIGREKENSTDVPRKSWWQWLLLHPTLPAALIPLIVALWAGVPQLLQWKAARDLNVPTSELARTQEQKRAWETNRECLQTEIQQVALRSPATYTISLQACPSGDILLALTPLHAPANPTYEWILTRKLLLTPQASFSFTTTARAQVAPPNSAAPIRVIDVRTQGRNVVRRLQLANNACIDETVDTATGRRLSSNSAPCTRF